MNPLYSATTAAALLSGLVGGFTGYWTDSADTPDTISQATLRALDPTLAGRRACRGIDATGAQLDQRLKLAGNLAALHGVGAAGMALIPNLAQSSIPATGISGDARAYFDQAMLLTYGFNHQGATRAFQEARLRAPDCAMCLWGVALASGPNINAPMSPEQNSVALTALAAASRLAETASPLERDLIAAQTVRYSNDPAADRALLDAAYADAMFRIARQNPGNDDIAILAAEAAMNTTPWDYWSTDKSAAKPRIAEAVAMLEAVMQRNPHHPQAAHLYIHLMENSANPHRAEAAADRMAQFAPDAFGHLVHMPSHIYYRIGRYKDSMAANILAARADEDYLTKFGGDGMYRFGYYPHNVHFLLTSAQMAGDMYTTLSETERLKSILNVDIARQLPWVQVIHAAPDFALAQYASPQAIIALTNANSDLAYVEAMRRYARAVGFAISRNDKSFAAELAAMDALAENPQFKSQFKAMTDGGVPAMDLIALARHVAQGRMAHAKGKFTQAAAHYRQAITIEQTLPYTEPPYWYYPVSQSLGASLYRAGDFKGARDAFQAALFKAPNDGWALYGLAQTERKLGHKPEAAAAEAALDKSWLGKREWLDMDRL